MKLFQYVIMYNPKKEGEKAVLIKDVTTIMAKDAEVAAKLATRQIPVEYDEKLEDVDVVLRPF